MLSDRVAVIVTALDGLDCVPGVLRKLARTQHMTALETVWLITLSAAASWRPSGARLAIVSTTSDWSHKHYKVARSTMLKQNVMPPMMTGNADLNREQFDGPVVFKYCVGYLPDSQGRKSMFRQFFMGAAALTVMTGAAFADGYSSTTTTTVTRGPAVTDVAPPLAPGVTYVTPTPAPGVTYVTPTPAPGVTYVAPARRDPAGNVFAGGVSGAALGAGIGCLASLPVGCAPGAALGAAIGGGTGAVVGGAASIPPPQYSYP